MKTLKPLFTLVLVLVLGGCETPESPVVPAAEASARYPVPPPSQAYSQPAVNVGVGFGSGGHAYGGVGFHQGPFSLFLGF